MKQVTGRAMLSPKRRLTFKELHGVISKKIEFFITTVTGTSSPTLSPSSSGYNTDYCERVYPAFMIPSKNIPGSCLKIGHAWLPIIFLSSLF
jgi:hypothetical protein